MLRRPDGKKWHVPYFVGFFLDQEELGFPLLREQGAKGP